MKIVVLISLILSYTCLARALLKCNSCVGQPGGDCADGAAWAMKEVECTEHGLEAQCYEHDVTSGSKRMFTRGCTKRTTPDLCRTMRAAQKPTYVYSCYVCNSDFCN